MTPFKHLWQGFKICLYKDQFHTEVQLEYKTCNFNNVLYFQKCLISSASSDWNDTMCYLNVNRGWAEIHQVLMDFSNIFLKETIKSTDYKNYIPIYSA